MIWAGYGGPGDAFTNAQRYGIAIAAGSSDNYTIVGCKVAGNGGAGARAEAAA